MKENYPEQEWEARKEKEMKLWAFYFMQLLLFIPIGYHSVFDFNNRANNFQTILFFITVILIFTPFWKTKVKASLNGEGTLTPKGYWFFLTSIYVVLLLFFVGQSIFWIRYLFR